MKTRLLLILTGIAIATSNVLAQTPTPKPTSTPTAAVTGKTKIGILSFLALREGIDELKQKYQKLQAEFAPQANALDAMRTSIENKEKVINENKNLTLQQARKLSDEAEQLKKEYQRKAEDSQEAARRREREETGPILDKISDFLEKYCQQRGITHVFDLGRLQETGVALYAAPGTNITEDFIKEYNKANLVPTSNQPKQP